MKRIGILTCIWKRPELTRYVLDYYAKMEVEGVRFSRRAVASEPIGPQRGWTIIQEPNRPLGKKWNQGCEEFKRTHIDGLVVVGSDDLLNARFFEVIRDLDDNVQHAELDSLYYYDTLSGDMVYLPRAVPGAGRYFNRTYLRRAKWRLWMDGTEEHLDADPYRWAPGVTKRRIESRPTGAALVDIKSDINMWSFGYITHYPGLKKVDPVSTFRDEFGVMVTDIPAASPPRVRRLGQPDGGVEEVIQHRLEDVR